MAPNNTHRNGPRKNLKVRRRDYDAAVAFALPVPLIDQFTAWRLAFEALPESRRFELLKLAALYDGQPAPAVA